MEYDAFISYSRSASAALAHSLHGQLQKLAKERSDRIFRDTAKLSFKVCPTWPERIQANMADWMAVLDAMAASRWLVLLASAEAARSLAVNREVEYWLTVKTIDRIAVVAQTAEPSDEAGTNLARESLPPALWTRVDELPVVLTIEPDLSHRGARRKFQIATQQLAAAIYPEQRPIGGRRPTSATPVCRASTPD